MTSGLNPKLCVSHQVQEVNRRTQHCPGPTLVTWQGPHGTESSDTAKALKGVLTLSRCPHKAIGNLQLEPNWADCVRKEKCHHSQWDLNNTRYL